MFANFLKWLLSLFTPKEPSAPTAVKPPVVVQATRINRKKFFDYVRANIDTDHALTQEQVNGFNRTLDEFDRRPSVSKQKLPIILATQYWETGRTMQPVREAYWLSEDWRKRNLRYYPYYGRGDVQLTWLENYKKATSKYGIDFVKYPDKVMEPSISIKILFDGMLEGWFTGKKISDYLDELDESDEEDLREYIASRPVVNAKDKATEIGKLALHFEKAIK